MPVRAVAKIGCAFWKLGSDVLRAPHPWFAPLVRRGVIATRMSQSSANTSGEFSVCIALEIVSVCIMMVVDAKMRLVMQAEQFAPESCVGCVAVAPASPVQANNTLAAVEVENSYSELIARNNSFHDFAA